LISPIHLKYISEVRESAPRCSYFLWSHIFFLKYIKKKKKKYSKSLCIKHIQGV